MKRWNVRGSEAAKVRMAELREEQLHLRKVELIAEWERVTGCTDRLGWWKAAQAASLKPGCGTKASIEFLRSAIAQAREPPHA